ncbi:hypothetical protein DFH09DRAFT_1431101 [Mycena vulgaris]|nr:hypothetical protein DFH09DRAFT_1431101 [Mycena vulgaris]
MHAPFSDIHPGIDTPGNSAQAQQFSAHCSYQIPHGRPQNLEQKANDAFIELFVYCGIPRRFIGREEFTHFVNAVSQGNYKVTSRTKFEDALVPFEDALPLNRGHRALADLLFFNDNDQHRWRQALSKKFVSVHITNVHRQSVCVDLDDVSRVSQTGEYFAELLTKISAIICTTHAKICNTPVFQPIIAGLKEVFPFMSLSSYSQDWFDETRARVDGSPAAFNRLGKYASIVRNRALGIDAEILETPFLDEEDVYKFRRDLTRLNSVLMPFARGIQCLESKDTTPADELIRSIANFQFSQLIEEERASEVHSTVFVLDPGVFLTIEALGVQPVTLLFTAGQLAVKEELSLIQRIGSSLQKILQREYGAEYRPDCTVQDLSRTSWMAKNPGEDSDILAALAVKIVSCNLVSMRKERGMSTVAWMNSGLRNQQQVSTVSNYLMIGGFSRMNSKKWLCTNKGAQRRDKGKTKVPQNALGGVQWNRDPLFSLCPSFVAPLSVQSRFVDHSPSKPVTVNWRDIRDTIHGKLNADPINMGDSDNLDAESVKPALKHHDPVQDGLNWLNEGLPDLRSTSSKHFDLAAEFDIQWYLHILANNIEGPAEAPGPAHLYKNRERQTMRRAPNDVLRSTAPPKCSIIHPTVGLPFITAVMAPNGHSGHRRPILRLAAGGAHGRALQALPPPSRRLPWLGDVPELAEARQT